MFGWESFFKIAISTHTEVCSLDRQSFESTTALLIFFKIDRRIELGEWDLEYAKVGKDVQEWIDSSAIPISKNIYRFMPIELKSEDLEMIHGYNEKISKDSFMNMIQFYIQFIRNINDI